MQCEKAQSTGPRCSKEKLIISEFKWRKLDVKAVIISEEPSPFKLHVIPALSL